MLHTKVNLTRDDLLNSDTRYANYTDEYIDGSYPGEERNQVVTSSGNRVNATPYHVIFNDGAIITSKTSSQISLSTMRQAGGKDWLRNKWNVELDVPRSLIPAKGSVLAPAPTKLQTSAATTQALGRARQGMVNVAILLKERKATIEMAANRIKSMQDGAIALQRRALRDYYRQTSNRGRKKVYDRYANLHLEYLFGWATTANELYSLADAIGKEQTKYIIGRGRGSDNDSFPGRLVPLKQYSRTIRSIYTDTGGFGPALYVKQQAASTQTVTLKRRSKASLRYKVDIRALGAANKYGFASGDALFDAVPLSFLLNFSTNLQSYLAAKQPMVGATYVTGCVTSYNTINVETKIYSQDSISDGQQSKTVHGASSLQLNVVRTDVIRNVYHVEPDPSFVLQANLSIAKAVTGALIGIQQRNSILSRLMRKKSFATPPRRKPKRGKYLPPINYKP